MVRVAVGYWNGGLPVARLPGGDRRTSGLLDSRVGDRESADRPRAVMEFPAPRARARRMWRMMDDSSAGWQLSGPGRDFGDCACGTRVAGLWRAAARERTDRDDQGGQRSCAPWRHCADDGLMLSSFFRWPRSSRAKSTALAKVGCRAGDGAESLLSKWTPSRSASIASAMRGCVRLGLKAIGCRVDRGDWRWPTFSEPAPHAFHVKRSSHAGRACAGRLSRRLRSAP